MRVTLQGLKFQVREAGHDSMGCSELLKVSKCVVDTCHVLGTVLAQGNQDASCELQSA